MSRKRRRIRTLQQRNDPSRTNGVVRLYIGDLNRRWERIASLIWQTIVVNDALRLGDTRTLARPATRFDFRSDPEGKIEDFVAWLNDALDDEVLEIVRGPAGRITRNTRWQGVYVRSAYSRGLEHAQRELRRAGARLPAEAIADLFNAPIHADTLRILYTRQFSELQGITRATEQRIARVLTDGLARGLGPREMARNMRKQVKTIGVNRSKVLARTETINAHATATLNRFEQVGVREIVGESEFLSARDDRVCPDCEALDGQRFTLSEARGIIPVHAQCLTGDTLVATRGRITSATKRWYDGDLVVLQCADALPLSVTPNHPILTRLGWLPASALKVGDEVAHPGVGQTISGRDREDVQVPSRAEDMAESFLASGEVVAVEVPVSAPDFHGDGAGSEVAVVGTYRELRDGLDAVATKCVGKLDLFRRHIPRTLLHGARALHVFLFGTHATLACAVCGRHLMSPLSFGHAGPLEKFSLGAPTRGNTVLGEATIDNVAGDPISLRESQDAVAGTVSFDDVVVREVDPVVGETTHSDAALRESRGDRAARNTEPFGEGEGALAGVVEPDDLVFRELIFVGHDTYSGWVYNFETTVGYYIANGYTSGNCRCVWLPVL